MNRVSESFSWIGSQEDFVDLPNIHRLNRIVIGRYGGNSAAGQYKNEDGCLVWFNDKEDWEFVIILDAHNTAESAEIVVNRFKEKQREVRQVLSLPVNHFTFKSLEELVLNIFQEQEFLSACRKVQVETACLIVVRKDKYVWWFSVGDCVLYLFHPELIALGQYQLNQRQFYEWIGQVNTFDQRVPCFSTGIKELRQGVNHLFLTTDGLIECPGEPYTNPSNIVNAFSNSENDEAVLTLLLKIQDKNVRDSTTIVSWKVNILREASQPSNG
ncbi:protein phosphatase 2C domain-containing protein [Paenisporosarcina sp. TG20]|uniref:protein phosphatase 2C domain-containing protein n=1 Tax=Paenisporosarcina sp. TG20 TaxID=1211706 RepID=UPI00030A00FD|nr:protein phosphatase 2C domain-containing protein [Paenisporosarcina sp. TG20]